VWPSTAFALLLTCTRQIGRSVRTMTRHRWAPLTGEELGGKRMLAVGLGLIGEEIARRALAWDRTVAGIKRGSSSYQGVVRDVRDPGALPELCEWADVVVLSVPSTAGTRGLIGRASWPCSARAGW
jgi:phosphoglycerate dehydrogenase-like enzyme